MSSEEILNERTVEEVDPIAERRRLLLGLPEIQVWLSVVAQAKAALLGAYELIEAHRDFVAQLPQVEISELVGAKIRELRLAFEAHAAAVRFFVDDLTSVYPAVMSLCEYLGEREEDLLAELEPRWQLPLTREVFEAAAAAYRRRARTRRKRGARA